MRTVWVEYDEAVYGDLPAVCMRCGEDATVTRTKTLSWYPGSLNGLLILVGLVTVWGLLIWWLAVSGKTKRMKLKAPFCDRHKGHWLNFNLFVFAGLAFHFGLFVAWTMIDNNNDPTTATASTLFAIGSGISFLLYLIGALVWRSTLIKALEITEDDMKLSGVCEEFRTALLEQRREDSEYDRTRHKRRSKRYPSKNDEYDDE